MPRCYQQPNHSSIMHSAQFIVLQLCALMSGSSITLGVKVQLFMPALGAATPPSRLPLPSERVSPDNGDGMVSGQETARLLAAADTTTAQLSALSAAPLPVVYDDGATAALRSTVEEPGTLISDYRTEVSR